jgi:serine/threonine-protein kinase TTK/MPS1
MAAIASPTPASGDYLGLQRRPSRSVLPRMPPAKSNLRRGSPLSNAYRSDDQLQKHTRNDSTYDSSDDEEAIPKLSAAAEELLGVRTGERPTASHGIMGDRQRIRTGEGSPVSKDQFQAPRFLARERTTSPTPQQGSPRIIKLSGGRSGPASIRRATSIAAISDGSPLGARILPTMKTPASGIKSTVNEMRESPQDIGNYSSKPPSAGSAMIGASTGQRNKSEEPAVQNSLRIKRIGKVSGSFLSGPARRGIIRRQSEEDHVPYTNDDVPADDEHADWIPKTQRLPTSHQQTSPLNDEEKQRQRVRFTRASTPKAERVDERPHIESPDAFNAHPVLEEKPLQPIPMSNSFHASSVRESPQEYRPSDLPPIAALRDQENAPPPTFKRDKQGIDILASADKFRQEPFVSKVQLATSPSRKPLAIRSQNTPLRPAPPPPPPKMSVLETATATAGAASSANAKKRTRTVYSVNGKHFTRMELVGRGGSGKVYRVMAENSKHFALKIVSLEDLDELTIRGFKGEIELLRKLENVDRVVRLYDFEINEKKKILLVLMDIAELDLKKLLDPKIDEETGKFDVTFTRYIWKEMLECVQAVHKFDIVHSDLKPANFVMMQGRLKLIDFGIANAIQDDTVNVHREQQVGTPNYMSPETLLDTNSMNGHRASGAGKLIKVGKPSDVWSLGCILYQIVYGKTPFSHITNNVRKVMAITDPSHAITYPAVGIGGVPVPTGLIRTLKKCLDREISRRPTIEQLLSENDIFLHPDAAGTVPVSQDLIGRLQHNIINHIQRHGIPSEADLAQWPAQFFASIKAAVEDGRA